MPDNDPESIVRAYLTAFNERDRERLKALLTEGVIEHGVHDVLEGREEIIGHLEAHFEAFPDYSGTSHDILIDEDQVTVRYSARGTHTGEYKNVDPTGLAATWKGIAIYRVEEGEIAEIWLEEDRLGLLEQLEFVDATEPAHLRL